MVGAFFLPSWDLTIEIILTPFELLERLVTSALPPKKNLIPYDGVFAPNAALKDEVVASKEVRTY